MTTIACIEDDEHYRSLVTTIIGACPRYTVVGSFAAVAEALTGLPSTGADVILIDVRLRGHSGIQGVAQLHAQWPRTRCVMLTSSEAEQDLFAALEAGAAGYLLKSDSSPQLIAALDELVAGGAALSRSVARQVLKSFAKPPLVPRHERTSMTRREREIMHELARGHTYKEISRKLGISPATVKNHLYRIYEKIGVRSRTEAVVAWLKQPPERDDPETPGSNG